jgi:hypothetical protein
MFGENKFLSNSTAFVMTWKGHEWYVLNVNSRSAGGADAPRGTFVYDSLSKEWFKWERSDKTTEFMLSHMFVASPIAFGALGGQPSDTHFFGDGNYTARVYELDEAAFTHYPSVGSNLLPIERERTTSHFFDEFDRRALSVFQLEGEVGDHVETQIVDTLTSGAEAAAQTVIEIDSTTNAEIGHELRVTLTDGTIHYGIITAVDAGVSVTIDPGLKSAASSGAVAQVYTAVRMSLEWSKNSGNTFGTRIFAVIGGTSAYLTRLLWRNLGVARKWTFRIKTTVLSKVVFTRASAKRFGEDLG